MTEKKEEKKASKKTHRAYSKYVQDPVFVGMFILCLLFAMAAFLVGSGYHCPTGATVIADDTVTDTVDVDDTPVVDTGDKLIVYEFSEFKCPYCSAAVGFNDALEAQFKTQMPNWTAAVPEIKDVYGDQVQVVFKHFIVHESARKASEAAECARDQDKFDEMHDIMFQNMANLEPADLKSLAAQIGLDSVKFDACLDNGDKSQVVKADTDFGRSLGVTGTPTFFVGGEEGYKVIGAQPYSAFVDPIDKALAGELPEPEPAAPPVPEAGPSVGKFSSYILDEGVCTEDGKPIIRLFSTTWCPHCVWTTPVYESVVQEYVDAGKIVAKHWEVDINDDTLTEEVEGTIPEDELAWYKTFNPRGSIPTFVFGCKYYRIGAPYERMENGTVLEEQEFRDVIDAILEEVAA